MDECHEFQFAGIWIPPHVCELLRTRELSGSDLILYTIIKALQGKDGCYASNAYLAQACGGMHPRKIQDRLRRLKDLGLVKQTRFDGRLRYLRVVERNPGVPKTGTSKTPKRGTPVMPKNGTHKEDKSKEKKLNRTPPTPPQAGGKENNGFGIAPPKRRSHTTQFDKDTAATLEKIVRQLPERTTGISQSRLSTWPRHIRSLRTRDSIPEETITRVLNWYGNHIGETFVPQAYDGNTFRKKFHAIEAAMARDLTTIKISPDAKSVAERLTVHTWPMGSAEEVPAAVQAGITAYTNWIRKRNIFLDHLNNGNLNGKYSTPLKNRVISIATDLKTRMPPATFFIERWMERVHGRVWDWDGWDGKLAPLVFKPQNEEFQRIGRQWAIDFTGDAKRWDEFYEMMEESDLIAARSDSIENPHTTTEDIAVVEDEDRPLTEEEIDALVYASPRY